MYLAQLTISNFRRIEKVVLDFQPGLNVIVGPNNIGKTAVVDALRALLAGYDESHIRLDVEDIHRPKGHKTGIGPIEFSYVFRDLSKWDEATLMPAVRPGPGGALEAAFTVRYSDPDPTSGRLKPRRWCGEFEEISIPVDLLEQLRGVYLPPLRDAAQGLKPSRTSQLARLIQLLSEPEDQKTIDVILKDLDAKLKAEKPIKSTQSAITTRHSAMLGDQLSQPLEVGLSANDFKRLSARLSLLVDNLEIELNGLGFNNLIYMAVVLGEMAKNDQAAFQGLIIEEPEAHLHPQLQSVLLRYLQGIEKTAGESQVQLFVTSHSPNFASAAKLDTLACLFDSGEKVKTFFPRTVKFESGRKEKLERYLDVTRASLFFARRVIFVEGAAELAVVHSLALKDKLDLRSHGRETSRDRVRIQTIDGLLTNDVLRPHAYRTMKCARVPFLVDGSEGFLNRNGFKFFLNKTDGSGRYPISHRDIGDLFVRRLGTKTSVHLRRKGGPAVEVPSGMTVLARWARVGAYTHNFGQYWAYETLVQQPWLAAAMALRYPHILVDEAQDIGYWHEAVLELLIANGSQMSLIGDPHQAIFEFAGADGQFLENYGNRHGVRPKTLSVNFRSVKAVQDVANLLSSRKDTTDRVTGSKDAGAFFLAYHDNDLALLEKAFFAHVRDNKLDPTRSAVICRGQSLKKRLRAYEADQGEGLVKRFAKAALLRDEGAKYHQAYKLVVSSVCELLPAAPNDLAHDLSTPWTAPRELSGIARLLWSFTRDTNFGLPSALLAARSQWHPQLLDALERLVKRFEDETPLRVDPKYRNRIRTNGLPSAALLVRAEDEAGAMTSLRASTVHGVKGESLDAVLYITEKSHAVEMAAGTLTEVGRIGYVALTRARDIFWMAVPATAIAELRPQLAAKGLVERPVIGVGEQAIKVRRSLKVKDSPDAVRASAGAADAGTPSPAIGKTM